MTKRINIYIATALLMMTVIFTACSGKKKDIQAAKEETHKEEPENEVALTAAQFKTADIQYGKPEWRELSSVVKVNGLLDVPPQQTVSVSVPLGGFIKFTKMLQGMWVKKGEVMAVLENLEYIQLQQDYLDLKSQLEYANTEYERQQALARENVNALKTLQQSKANFQSLTVKVKGLREKLQLLNVNMTRLEKGEIQSTVNVYAPISGYVTQVNINTGQLVTPSDIMFRVVDTEHLHAELTVFEKDIPKLKEGQKVRFVLANESKERTASVHLIGREIAADRTVRVHCHLDAEDRGLLPGTYLQAIIETGAAKVEALPDAAIVDYENKSYIFVQIPESTAHSADSTATGKETPHHNFRMLPVEKGASELGYTAVTLPKNWNPDTAIVIKGAYDLLAQLKNSGEEGHGH